MSEARARRSKAIFAAAVYLQVFALLFELACPRSLLPELSSVLLLGALALRLACGGAARLRWLVRTPTLLLAAYTALDLLSFMRSEPQLFRMKYRVVAVCAFTAFCLALALTDGGVTLSGIYLTSCSAGMSAAFAALLDRFLLHFSDTQYTERITLRNDYNMYATVLLCAAIGGLGALLARPPTAWRYAAFFASAAFLGGMAYLSGSRRIFMAQLPAGLLFVLAAVRSCILRVPQKAGKTDGTAPRRARAAVSLGAAAVSAIIFTAAAAAVAARLPALLETKKPPLQEGSAAATGETTLLERYESLDGGGAFETRRALWGAALGELRRMSAHPAALLFGRGGGYDIALYDRLLESGADERLSKTFGDAEKYRGKLSAHNFLLSDMLCGGAVKLALALALCAALAVSALRAALSSFREGLPCAMLLATALVNSFISNRFGLLYDRYFWIGAMLLVFITAKTHEGGDWRHEKIGQGC